MNSQKPQTMHFLRRYALLLLGLSLNFLSAQTLTTAEQYLPGTRIQFFPDACGTPPPQAAGRLTFCDANDNLGVVTHSLGLNDRGTLRMAENYFDDSEVYVTRRGLSIRFADGRWDNLPNVALEVVSSTGRRTNDASVESAVVARNGLIYFTYRTTTRRLLGAYDFRTRTISYFSVPFSAGDVNLLAYDADGHELYAVASSGTGRSLLKLEGDGLELVADLNGLISNPAVNIEVAKLAYFQDSLYFGNNQGLFVLDTLATTVTRYDQSVTGRLPYDDVNDFDFAPNGTVWLAVGDNNEGALVYLDRHPVFGLETETYAVARPDNPTRTVQFSRLAVVNQDQITAVAGNFFGLVDLDLSNEMTNWGFIDRDSLDNMGLPITYSPSFVARRNGSTFYLTNDFSTGNSLNSEVLIRAADGSWTTRNDNRPTNISFWDVERFRHFEPAPTGGVYLYNDLDDVVTNVSASGNLGRDYYDNLASSAPVTDERGRLVLASATAATPFYLLRTPPFERAFEGVRYGNTRAVSYGNVVAFFNWAEGTYVRTVNGRVVARDTLPNPGDYGSFFQAAVDSEGLLWLAGQDRGAGMPLVRYDPAGGTVERFDPGFRVGNPERVLAGPDGVMYFLGRNGFIYYDGSSLSEVPTSSVTEFSQIRDGAVDTLGNLYLLTDARGGIFRVSNAGTTPTVEGFTLEDELPFSEFRTASAMTLDADGDLWVEGETSAWRVSTDWNTPYFRPSVGSRTISGRVYADRDGNGNYEAGEGVGNQVVVLTIDGRTRTTTTDESGSYVFLAEATDVDYRFTLPTIDRYFAADIRQVTQAVGAGEENLAGPDFILTEKDYRSLYFQSANRAGMWGFDRDGFANVFTTAVTNLSPSTPFRELDIDFSYFNVEPGTGNALPDVKEVRVTRLTPTSAGLLIDKLTIHPRTHAWRLDGLTPSDFTREALMVNETVTETTDTVNVNLLLDEIGPRQTIIIEVETEVFAGQSNGTAIGYGTRRVDSRDFDPNERPFILFPDNGNDPVPPDPFDDPNNPYVDPNDVYDPPPYLEPRQVYAPPPYSAPIRSSYDPNDKLVDGGLPTGVNDTPMDKDWLGYTIRFENTGNFSAKDVYIVDTLDGLLDANSLRLLTASHDLELDYELSDDSTTVLRFNFEDIFLPFADSINDGFVSFALRADENLELGDTISNGAAIYFDQNPPIITNVVRNRFVEIRTSVESVTMPSVALKAFPNPATDRVRVEAEQPILSAEVFDQAGRSLPVSVVRAGEFVDIGLGGYPAGIFFVRVATGEGVGVVRVVVR